MKKYHNYLKYLNFSHLASRFHTTCYIDRVPPDVVLWLLRTHHSGNHTTLVKKRKQSYQIRFFGPQKWYFILKCHISLK